MIRFTGDQEVRSSVLVLSSRENKSGSERHTNHFLISWSLVKTQFKTVS